MYVIHTQYILFIIFVELWPGKCFLLIQFYYCYLLQREEEEEQQQQWSKIIEEFYDVRIRECTACRISGPMQMVRITIWLSADANTNVFFFFFFVPGKHKNPRYKTIT